MRAYVIVGLLAVTPVAATVAQEAPEGDAYTQSATCAGKFMWLLNASSGGQPPVNEYTLDERVAGLSKFEALAKAAAEGRDPAPDVANEIVSISDATIDTFFDDPDAVENDLMVCARLIGLRSD